MNDKYIKLLEKVADKAEQFLESPLIENRVELALAINETRNAQKTIGQDND